MSILTDPFLDMNPWPYTTSSAVAIPTRHGRRTASVKVEMTAQDILRAAGAPPNAKAEWDGTKFTITWEE